jgi:L-threonylcarbamoyladenylate synthase
MNEEIINHLKSGHIGILPTDTLYGLVGSALRPETVERIYSVKSRDPQKLMITLISDISDLEKFYNISLEAKSYTLLASLWPGKVSVILPHGNKTPSFRVPDNEELRNILKETGPLVAPSANPEGSPPATTIEEAKNYFGSSVDFYVDKGKLEGEPSTLIELWNGMVTVVRQGAVVISSN